MKETTEVTRASSRRKFLGKAGSLAAAGAAVLTESAAFNPETGRLLAAERKEGSRIKITGVKVIVTSPALNFVAVKILTSEPGLYGVGDASLYGRELAVATLIEEHLAPLLLGRDPDQIEDTWQYIFRGSYWRGGPVMNGALSGIDMALWDIKGKRAGMPVYQLLGGRCRRGAMAYVGVNGRDFPEVEDRVRQTMERGFKAIRCHVAVPGLFGTYGAPRRTSEERLAAKNAREQGLPFEEIWEPLPYLRTVPKLFAHLRNTIGDNIELLHDVHERLTPIEAARFYKEMEPFHPMFVEDPLRPEHKESFRLLRQHTSVPLAMGEVFSNLWEVLPLVVNQWIDYVRCDLQHVGGITAARKIAAIAEPFYVKTAFHGPSDDSPITHAANVHVDLAIPNFGVQEWVFHTEQVQEVFPGGPRIQDGYLVVDEVPGLGVDLNERAAKKYPYRRRYLPTVRRRDGSVQDW